MTKRSGLVLAATAGKITVEEDLRQERIAIQLEACTPAELEALGLIGLAEQDRRKQLVRELAAKGRS